MIENLWPKHALGSFLSLKNHIQGCFQTGKIYRLELVAKPQVINIRCIYLTQQNLKNIDFATRCQNLKKKYLGKEILKTRGNIYFLPLI